MTEEAEGLATGSVLRWHAEEGWGVLTSPEVTGAVFAHYSMIRDQTGWRGLTAGQRVRFTWEPHGQDGCPNRAVEVYSGDDQTRTSPEEPSGADGAFSSSLTVDFGDGPIPYSL